MDKQKYSDSINRFAKNKTAYKILKMLYMGLPALVFVTYPVMLIIKGFLALDRDFLFMLCIPAGTLVLVSLLRKIINRPRPYERFDTPPLFDRDGKGESMPSRHTSSAFIIATSALALNVWAGIGLLIIAAIIGLTRILSGVHYISDVLAGAGLSIIIGTVFFIIL